MTWKPEVPLDVMDEAGGNWLKWADGETRTVLVLSNQPQTHTVHWVDGKGHDCTGTGCSLCQAGIRGSMRYTVVCECDGVRSNWEMAMLTFRDLAAIAEMSGTLRGLMVRVRRRGTGRQTRYSIIREQVVAEDDLPRNGFDNGPGERYQHPKPEGLLNPDYTKLEDVQLDPEGAAAYAKELASALETNARAELEALAQDIPDRWPTLDRVGKLHLLITTLEQRERDQKAKELELEEQSLEELLF